MIQLLLKISDKVLGFTEINPNHSKRAIRKVIGSKTSHYRWVSI